VTSRDGRRAFTTTQKNEILHQQDGKCAECQKKLDQRVIEYHHIKAWAAKGRTVTQNGAALCPICHKLKTHKERLKSIDRKAVEPKPVTSMDLGKLTTDQLKLLAQKHRIRVTGAKSWNLWDGDYTKPPTKQNYVSRLKGLVTDREIDTLASRARRG
jgi:predicted restriction endonuclease